MSRPAASADVFVAIADPTRRSLVDQLRRESLYINQCAFLNRCKVSKVVAISKEQLSAEWKLPINTEQDWVVDTTRIRKELGYKEIVPPDEALRRTIDRHWKHPPQESVEALLLDYATEDPILGRIKHG